MSLWKGIKWILKIFFGGIILTLVLNIASNYIYPLLKGKELRIFEEFIALCKLYWNFLILFLTIIVVILFYAWARERKEEFREIWEFYKPVKKLAPGNFKIQKYKKEYIQRVSNITIENLLNNWKHVLIIGKPKIGKTRAAYEEIRKLKDISVIKLRPENIEIVKIKIPPLSNKNLVLFIDDFGRFIDLNIEDIIDRLKKKSKKLIIVATCRTGKELSLVQEEKPHLYREFISVKLEEISETDGINLAKRTGTQWKKTQFDGTPGSVILDLEDMKNRYKKAADGKIILKALKLLKKANLYIYKELRVKDICGDIFELPIEKLRRYNWDEIINNLKKANFITSDKGLLDIYPSYLDICIYDYDAPLNDLLKLKNMLIRFRDSGCLLYLGQSFYHKKEFEYAKDCYLESLEIYPKYASAHSNLGYVLTKLGEAEESKRNIEEAEKLYKEAEKEHRIAISLNSYYFVDHNNLGYVLTRLGKIQILKKKISEAEKLYKEAEKEHRIAISLNQNFSPAHCCLAYVLGELKMYKEAEMEYREAIRLAPESPFAHNLIGHLLTNKFGRNKEAEMEYREAIRIKSDYPSACNNLAYLFVKLERLEEAEKKYREAIEANPDYIVAYLNLGHLLADWGRYEEAEKEYRKALGINPNYAKARKALGYVLMNLKKYNEAELEYIKALKISPNDAKKHSHSIFLSGKLTKIYANLARSFIKTGKFDEAKKFIIKALRLNPNSAMVHKNFGILQEELGDREKSYEDKLRLYKEAEKEYRKALELKPMYPSARRHLANTLEKLGKNKEAEEEYKKTKKITDSYPKNNRDFGIFLSKIGRKENAIKELELALKLFKKRRNKKEERKVKELLKGYM